MNYNRWQERCLKVVNGSAKYSEVQMAHWVLESKGWSRELQTWCLDNTEAGRYRMFAEFIHEFRVAIELDMDQARELANNVLSR